MAKGPFHAERREKALLYFPRERLYKLIVNLVPGSVAHQSDVTQSATEKEPRIFQGPKGTVMRLHSRLQVSQILLLKGWKDVAKTYGNWEEIFLFFKRC